MAMPKTKVAQAVANGTLGEKLPEVVKETKPEVKAEPKPKAKPIVFASLSRGFQFRVNANEKPIKFSGGFYSTTDQDVIDKLRKDRFFGGKVSMEKFDDSTRKIVQMRTENARFPRGSILSMTSHYEIEE